MSEPFALQPPTKTRSNRLHLETPTRRSGLWHKYGYVFRVVAGVIFPSGTGILPVANEERAALLLGHGQDARATACIASPYLRHEALTPRLQ